MKKSEFIFTFFYRIALSKDMYECGLCHDERRQL